MNHILYIDDNPADREYAQVIFEKSNTPVICALNTKDAFDLIKSEPRKWLAVICDILMPGDDDGLYFAQKLEAEGLNIPIILASGDERMMIFEHYSALKNYKGFIEKPITQEKFQYLIQHPEKNGGIHYG